MEILKLCRSCMKEVASWELKNFDANAVSMFTFCTTVEVSDDDELPKQFCYDCTIKIESSYTFIKKAQEVNVTLKNLISRAESSVIVKSENLNNVHYNEFDSLLSESSFTIAKINKNEESFNNKLDINPSPPEYSVNTTEETLKPEPELLEITFESNYFNADSGGLSCEDDNDGYKPLRMEKIKLENIESNDKNNGNHKKEQFEKDYEGSEINASDSKIPYNTRSKINQPYKFKIKESGEIKQLEDKNEKDTLFKCEICKMIFVYKAKLQKHIRNKHLKDTIEGDMPKVQEKGDTELKTCEFCDRTFTSTVWFSRHVQNEHSDSAKQYICPHCPKSFPSYHTWRYHKDRHEESRRFACETCGARFKLAKQLVAHARTHADSRPYICTQCGMAFKIKGILTKHQKLHLEEKPFLCTVCGFSTKILATLNSHMLIHTGERPYACNTCSYQTTSRSCLRRHELRHRGERRHACKQCDKRFYEPGTLARHVRIHTGERPFQCYLCEQTFTDGWKCKCHIMRTHRIPLEDIPRLSKTKKNL